MAVKFFDEEWYLARNPDVAQAIEGTDITALQHFELHGMHENRSPSPLFDAAYYLDRNPDVANAIAGTDISAYQHFELHGHLEGRDASPYFNIDHYLAANPDVRDALEGGNVSAYEHFQAHGQWEGRSPLASFDPAYYLAANADVNEAAQGNPGIATVHFMRHGVAEDDRNLNPVISIGAYLAANEDVMQAVEDGQVTGLAHLLMHGVKEGRPLGNGVSGAQFANDPVYKQAVQDGNTDAALARMSEVAPFLPEFEEPEGFVLPANWPIPQDFVPVEGTLLTVPEGWQPAEPVRLPDTFEQPFPVEVVNGVISFPEATGDIVLLNQDGQGVFVQGNFIGPVTISLNRTATVELNAEQVLVGSYADIGQVNVTGEGAVRALGTDGADNIDASGWHVVNLTVEAGAGDDIIKIADTQSAMGGDGADTFVIAATAGTGSVITVEDYNSEQGDVVDLTQVQGLNPFEMEVRGAEYTGGAWQWDGYNGDSVGIWFSGEAANLQLTGARGETMKFAIPDVPGFEAYDVLQVNIASGGQLRANDNAPEILVGGDGSQFFHAGTQADVMIGGAGRDTFIVREAAHSNFANIDRIADFTIGEDFLVSHSLVLEGNFINAGTVASYDAEAIGAALTAEEFGANAGAYFTIGDGDGARTYVALNDGTAGYDANADTLIDITGYNGDLANLQVIGVPDLGNLTENLAAA